MSFNLRTIFLLTSESSVSPLRPPVTLISCLFFSFAVYPMSECRWDATFNPLSLFLSLFVHRRRMRSDTDAKLVQVWLAGQPRNGHRLLLMSPHIVRNLLKCVRLITFLTDFIAMLPCSMSSGKWKRINIMIDNKNNQRCGSNGIPSRNSNDRFFTTAGLSLDKVWGTKILKLSYA